MINTDRIVPITAIDLISMYGLILKQSKDNGAVSASHNGGIEGNFTITASGTWLADEPVKTINIASGVSSATIFFVPAYDYDGFTVNGAAATIAANDVVVNPDGHTLYKAVLSSGTVTITQAGF